VAIQIQDKPEIEAFTRAVFHAEFCEGGDIASARTLGEILDGMKLDAVNLLNLAQSNEVKLLLRQQTEEAQVLGIFGAPSFTVGKELFWGNDRLEDALSWSKQAWLP
jgi:2-hydroxychromene-2-carboxylate isomerase